MTNWARDFALGLRTLRKNPGFAVVVVVTLALGIGANAAIFTLLDQVLLRALPIRDADRLVLMDQPGANHGMIWGGQTFSYPMYRQLRDQGGEVFEGVIARFATPLNMAADAETERVNGVLVTGNYFETLGIRPVAGRLLTPQDDQTPGAHPVAVLSHEFWVRRFGGDPNAVGRDVRINAQPITVIGVAQAGFRGVSVGASPDVFVPVTMKRTMTPTWDGLESSRTLWLNVLAKLRPGVTREQAEAAVNPPYQRILESEIEEIPGTSQRFREAFLRKRLLLESAQTGMSDIRDQFATPLKVLMGMVGLVLLIACANVSNLLIARSVARRRETAVRIALGSTRWGIVRQLLAETLLLASAGAAAGLFLAEFAARLLLGALPFESAARSFTASPDSRVIGFAVVLSMIAAVLAALAPALKSFRPDVAETLKNEATSVTGAASQVRLRKAMVAAQVALSLLLLIGAGLFARSLANLKAVDPGFQIESLLTFSIDPALAGQNPVQTRQTLREIQSRLEALPGVASASMADIPLLAGQQWWMTVTVEGYTPKEEEDMNPAVNVVGPDYFSTLGMPLQLGRSFKVSDDVDAPKVVIINRAMARYFFGEESPLGKRIGQGRNSPNLEIVGVVGDGRFQDLRTDPGRQIYLPILQSEQTSEATFFVRGSLDPADLAAAVRELVREAAPNLPIYNLKTMRAQVRDLLFLERTVSALSIAFGALATLLAGLGLYGVMAFSVVRRRREIGIRMALGADRPQVLGLVLREAAWVTAVGLVAGLAAGAVSAQLLQSQLFGLSPHDPITLVGAATLLAAVALAASYWPARRAAQVDPSTALRSK